MSSNQVNTFPEYLSAFTKSLGLENDNQLAKRLGVSRAFVWQMRHNGKASDEVCLEIARVLKLEPGLVLLSRDALKETGPVGEAYRRILERVVVVVLGVFLALGTGEKEQVFASNFRHLPVLKITGKIRTVLYSMIYRFFLLLTSSNRPLMG